MKTMRFKFITIILFSFLFGCSNPHQFKVNQNTQSTTTPTVDSFSNSGCASSELIRPKVDFLLLWDNSSSQLFVNDSTKLALAEALSSYDSSKFDYHVFMAPLIGSGNNNAALVAFNTDGLSSSAQNMLISPAQAPAKLNDFLGGAGSSENGLTRVVDLINANRSNGIFRNNANTIVVVMSNGDDNSYIPEGGFDSGYAREQYITNKYNQLISLKSSLNADQFRFMSISAHSACAPGYKSNYVYKETSKRVYEAGAPLLTDQGYDPTPDGYDICGLNFRYIFDGINNSIKDTLIKFQYNYWPIATTNNASFDPGKITVTINGQNIVQSNTNGFTYAGYLVNQNTRVLPTPGEPVTGHLIRLYGNAQLIYPQCIQIQTQSPADYYGYVALQTAPVPSTIRLIINGIEIPQANMSASSPQGWEYIGYFDSLNVKIASPTNPSQQGVPADNRSGYFIKIHGEQYLNQYTNGVSISATYDPASN